MAHSSGSPQEGQTDNKTSSQAQATPEKPDCGVTDGLENQHSDDVQRRPDYYSEIPPEEYISNDGSWYQSPFSKSLQKAETLFRNRFDPGQKGIMRQKRQDCNWEFENETTTSCSRNIQPIGEALQGLRSQFQMILDPSGGRVFSSVAVFSPSEVEFYQYPQAVVLSKHCFQLQQLMEQRAQLLFFHEYAQRTQVASCFVAQLGSILERTKLLLVDRGQVAGQPNSSWNLNLRALCQKIQAHVSHWDMLWAKARSDPYLRRVLFSRVETLASMRKTLHLLGMQALQLLERCIYTAFSALTAAQLDRVPRDALVDLLSAFELYNQVVEDQMCHFRRSTWNSKFRFAFNQVQLGSGLLLNVSGPRNFTAGFLMSILAQNQAQKAAKHLYSWATQQRNLLLLAYSTSEFKRNRGLHEVNSGLHTVQPKLQSSVEKVPVKPSYNRWSTNLPFTLFISRDRESLDALFHVLVTSTNLLDPHISKKPPLNTAEDSAVACHPGEGRLLNRPRMKFRASAVAAMDHRQSDACIKAFYNYKCRLWKEFQRAVINHFYHQPYNSALGSVNQWNEEMLLLLVSWLKQSCTEDLVPEECKESLNNFCSYILHTAAFIQWDEMMCVSLGSGSRDKCVPGVEEERGSIRTVTMDRILQLFPPLHTVLELLHQSNEQSDDSGGTRLKEAHLGLLCRSVVTVQSSVYWVMSKAYQFLASWTLSKFLLVTQGDLKDLKKSVESLVRSTRGVSRDSVHPAISQQTALLSQALTELHAFSDLILRSFSLDCKRMSMEIFEQTMPSARHWRISHRTECPSSPSEYAACAAQSVIGPVLKGVQPLPNDARVPALTEAMTAFLEAWMEHILKQKIKFSIQGALQLKQDFDLIRDLIRSEEYSLSEEMHQQLLSLRVFHQVDNAIVCLLQQPMAKSYLPSRGWEPFKHCCPNSARVVDQAAGSLNNLESMDIQATCHQALTQAESAPTPEILSSSPPESYLVTAQQEWLDLRIHSGSRWKLPSLKCLSKSEP
ncbi:hypothetical protein DNTS_029753 [Danionella cerebrum]|uniref:Coiled-coil protein 142 C-terminal domain-containing protein n=1 Tax=Danionella cerebrum TaxID=2873325 RepID=A0A553PUI6_9TELE|nr:hypothetical protein DNTS_029753 [Danionella translucida]